MKGVQRPAILIFVSVSLCTNIQHIIPFKRFRKNIENRAEVVKVEQVLEEGFCSPCTHTHILTPELWIQKFNEKLFWCLCGYSHHGGPQGELLCGGCLIGARGGVLLTSSGLSVCAQGVGDVGQRGTVMSGLVFSFCLPVRSLCWRGRGTQTFGVRPLKKIMSVFPIGKSQKKRYFLNVMSVPLREGGKLQLVRV